MSGKCIIKFCIDNSYKKCDQCTNEYCRIHSKLGCKCLSCGCYCCNKCEGNYMNFCNKCK